MGSGCDGFASPDMRRAGCRLSRLHQYSLYWRDVSLAKLGGCSAARALCTVCAAPQCLPPAQFLFEPMAAPQLSSRRCHRALRLSAILSGPSSWVLEYSIYWMSGISGSFA